MLFFGDGDIKCVEDEPDECGDGPHLFDCCVFFCFPLVWHNFFFLVLAKFPHTPCTYCIEYLNFETYMDTSRTFLSALETRSTELELHSLLMMDVVGDAEPMNGNPGVIEKLPKFDEDVLDAFESLPGDGAANESRRILLLLLMLFIKICCGG